MLHPELRLRLRELGIGLNSDLAGENNAPPRADMIAEEPGLAMSRVTRKGSRSDSIAPGNHRIEETEQGGSCRTDNGVSSDAEEAAPNIKDPCLDDLLLQLDDLDARSAALAKRATEARAKKEPAAEMSASSAGAADGVETHDRRDEPARATLAHPLEGVTLDGGRNRDFQRQGNRRQRDKPPSLPVAPPSPASDTHSAQDGRPHQAERSFRMSRSLSRSNPRNSASANPPRSPSSARASTGKSSCVSLPPLKPCSSAPGRLMRGSWASGVR